MPEFPMPEFPISEFPISEFPISEFPLSEVASDPGAEVNLAALFADDGPPAHDADFVAAVVRRAGRQRPAFELVWSGLVAALSALVLWAVGPVLAPVVKPLAAVFAVFAPIGLIAASVLFLAHPRTAGI